MGGDPVYLTTHQVARMLGVSLPTVVNWIKAGRLEAHRTPGGHRRIAREELIRFARSHSYPLPQELLVRSGPPRVLVVDGERDFHDMVAEYLQLRGNFEVRCAEGPLTAGLELGRFRPDLVLADLGMAGLDPIRLAQVLADDPELRVIRLVGLLAFPDPHLEERAHEAGYQRFLRKPVPLDHLWDVVRTVLARA